MDSQIVIFPIFEIFVPKKDFHEKIDFCQKIYLVRGMYTKYELVRPKIERARPKSRFPIFDYFFVLRDIIFKKPKKRIRSE